MVGIRRETRADRDRQPLGRFELKAQVDERRPNALDGRFELRHGAGRRDQQELVRTVTTHDGPCGKLGGEQAVHGEERLVACVVAVVVVQQAEVVDVNQRDAERCAGGPGVLEVVRKMRDQRTMVEGPGERVAPRGLHELHGLS